MPKIYLLLLNYNSWQDTIECLESIFRLDYPNFKVIVVDNNSPDNSLMHLQEWADGKYKFQNQNEKLKHIFEKPKTQTIDYQYISSPEFNADILQENHNLLFIQSGTNLGFAYGNNVFLKNVLNEDAYVWLLNPDMVVESNALSQLMVFQKKHSSNIVIGSVLKNYYQSEQIITIGGAIINQRLGIMSYIKHISDLNKISYIHGGCFFSHLSNFQKVGLLSEDYFLYWEESDWCYRAKNQGIKLVVCEQVICYDKVGGSIGRGYLAEYYYSLNALKFAHKFYPQHIPSILIFNILRLLKRLINFNFRRAFAILNASKDFLLKTK